MTLRLYSLRPRPSSYHYRSPYRISSILNSIVFVSIYIISTLILTAPISNSFANDNSTRYVNSSNILYALNASVKDVTNAWNALLYSYRYGSSTASVIRLRDDIPYTLTTDRRNSHMKKIAKDWSILSDTFSIYKGSIQLNSGTELLYNNQSNYAEIHNLGTNGILVEVHLKAQNDYYTFNHDKDNHTVSISFYTEDSVEIRTAPRYNSGILQDINWDTKRFTSSLTGILHLKYDPHAPIEITNGRYWLNIGIGTFSTSDLIPTTYRENLISIQNPIAQEINLHQYLIPRKTPLATSIEHVTLLPSGMLQVRLDGSVEYTLLQVGNLKYTLKLHNISFINNDPRITHMTNSPTISGVSSSQNIENDRIQTVLFITTRSKIDLEVVQAGGSLLLYNKNLSTPLSELQNSVSILKSTIEIIQNGVRLTYLFSDAIVTQSDMIGRQLFVRFNSKIELVDGINSPQLYINNYVDTAAFGDLYGHSVLTLLFREDAAVSLSSEGNQLIIEALSIQN